MKENIVKEKSYRFSLKIIDLYKYLVHSKKEYVLAKQILRCGTSIGAQIEESIGSQSRKDFLSKISISYKEARETHYWLRLLKDSDFIDRNQFDTLNADLQELLRLIGSIQKTVKQSL